MKLEFYFVFLFMAFLLSAKAKETGDKINNLTTSSNQTQDNETDSNPTKTEESNTTTKISPKEAGKKLNLGLSFRQINHFIFNRTSHFISFNFFGITTRSIKASYKIILQLYLILSGGNRDTTLSTATCTIGQAVDPNGGQAQADFDCEIEDLDKTKEYESFELYDSKDIAGIPEDKILINPVKTKKAIKNGKLLDYSLEENKNKLSIYFTVESINGTVSEKGEFIIVGTVNQEITEENKFNLKLAYPWKYMTKCIIPKAPAGKVEIVCQLHNSFSGHIMIAQQVIRKGSKELFTITSFKSFEELHWNKDALPTDNTTEEIISAEEAEKKLDISLSFRQINHFIFNPTSHFITFYFFGITTQPIKASYQFIIELYLILSGGVMDTTLSEAICTLEQAVEPKGKQAQADFSCKIPDLDETKTYISFEFYDSEFIVGIPDDEVLLNPVKTQEAIEAGNLTDYSLEEN